jgi:GNAT superfamily N-acetyltransferase
MKEVQINAEQSRFSIRGGALIVFITKFTGDVAHFFGRPSCVVASPFSGNLSRLARPWSFFLFRKLKKFQAAVFLRLPFFIFFSENIFIYFFESRPYFLTSKMSAKEDSRKPPAKGKALQLGAPYEWTLEKIAESHGLAVSFSYRGSSVWVVVTKDGNGVGHFVLEQDHDHMFNAGTSSYKQIKLLTVFVELAYRGKKIGTMLMEMAYWLALDRETGLRYHWLPPEEDEGPAAFHAKVFEKFKIGPVEGNQVEFPFERILLFLNKGIGFSL